MYPIDPDAQRGPPIVFLAGCLAAWLLIVVCALAALRPLWWPS